MLVGVVSVCFVIGALAVILVLTGRPGGQGSSSTSDGRESQHPSCWVRTWDDDTREYRYDKYGNQTMLIDYMMDEVWTIQYFEYDQFGNRIGEKCYYSKDGKEEPGNLMYESVITPTGSNKDGLFTSYEATVAHAKGKTVIAKTDREFSDEGAVMRVRSSVVEKDAVGAVIREGDYETEYTADGWATVESGRGWYIAEETNDMHIQGDVIPFSYTFRREFAELSGNANKCSTTYTDHQNPEYSWSRSWNLLFDENGNCSKMKKGDGTTVCEYEYMLIENPSVGAYKSNYNNIGIVGAVI